MRRATYGTSEQVLDFPLQDRIGFEANHVAISFFLQQTEQRWVGKGRITTKEFGNVQVAIPLDHRQQHPSPELGAGVIAASQHGPFQVAGLVEQKSG